MGAAAQRFSADYTKKTAANQRDDGILTNLTESPLRCQARQATRQALTIRATLSKG
jgi:hypothetical protein